MRICIISGVCFSHDAISNEMIRQADVLREAGHDVTLFAQASDGGAIGVQTVLNSWELLNHPAYDSADLAVFHFGVRYDLFNALVVTPGPLRRVVHFHNVTPPELLSGADRDVSNQSLEQLAIAKYADEVWCDSAHNQETLGSWTDVPAERTRLMELYVPQADEASPVRGVPPGKAVQVVSIGRFVPAKGLVELLDSLAALPEGVGPVRVRLCGSPRYSSPGYIARLEQRIHALPSHVSVELVEDLSDEELIRVLEETHVYATASHHEGFCVPVIEAAALGARVVATDAGALPATVGDCGDVVPTGDTAAMAGALASAMTAARGQGARLLEREGPCVAHIARFARPAYVERLLSAVACVQESTLA